MELINYLTLVVSNSSHFAFCDGSQRVSNHLSPMSPTPNEIITVSAPVKKCWRGTPFRGWAVQPPLYLSTLSFYNLLSHTNTPFSISYLRCIWSCSAPGHCKPHQSCQLGSRRGPRGKKAGRSSWFIAPGGWDVLHYIEITGIRAVRQCAFYKTIYLLYILTSLIL